MSKVEVIRTQMIPAPVDQVFTKVNDFNHWTAWSPWLILEKEAKVRIEKDGKHYSWDGKRVGAGEMKLINEVKNEFIEIDLTFLKPFKSKAKVSFKFKSVGDQTQVDWIMNSKLPFFLFMIKKMMMASIGMDFERGLRLLKDYVVEGEVLCDPKLVGIVDYPGCKYIGIKGASSIDDLDKSMSGLFKQLMAIDGVDFKGGLAITHKWDMINRQAEYTAGMIVDAIPSTIPKGFISGEIPATKVNSVMHKGAYHHLGNAWNMQSMLIRSKAFKHNKKIDPFEIYLNSPAETAPKDLLTDVCFPTH